MKTFTNQIFGELYFFKNKYHLKLVFNYKNKKKEINKVFDQTANNYYFYIGYTFTKNSGEYSRILFKNGKLTLETDFFNSVPLYYSKIKNRFFFSNNLRLILREFDNIQINQNNLTNYFIYGYEAFVNSSIYKNINFLKRLETFKILIRKNKIVLSKKKIPFKISLKKNFYLNLFDQKKIIYNKFKNKRISILTTGGTDSCVILNHFSKLNNKITSSFAGNKLSDDFILGKLRAKKQNLKHISINDKFESKDNLIKLLNEYAKITSGIGSSSEILIMNLIKKIYRKNDFVFTGFGGELYRNFLIDKNYFLENYITPQETLKKFANKNFNFNIFNKIKKKKFSIQSLHNFYLNERYTKNISRKNTMIRNFITPINFFANPLLYKSYIKEFGFKTNHKKLLENFLINDIDFEKKNLSQTQNINKFLKACREIFIKVLRNQKINLIVLDKKKIIKYLLKKNYFKRDSWFLVRILNLILFLNQTKS